jgi:hypothetical protein
LELSLVPSISMYSISTNSNRLDFIAQLAEHWTSIATVASLIPTVVRQTGPHRKTCMWCGYTG